jgi:hypothetical protein
MQLTYGRDFFIRQAKGSDFKEAVSLVGLHHDETLASTLNEQFMPFLADPLLYMRVILNSNGVLIGFLLAERARVLTLAINPNFLRKEVRDEVTKQLGDWARLHNSGKLAVPRALSANDWKAFWKDKGFKVEPAISGYEEIEFT